MVTLLGFMFILVNVLFVSIFIPDLVGPVHMLYSGFDRQSADGRDRALHGYIIALHLGCGRTVPGISLKTIHAK
jgi:hypothetical protein